MSEESERREGMGELRADVRNLIRGFDEFKDEFRPFKADVYTRLNKNDADIARAKGIGSVMHVIWTAIVGCIVAYLWGGGRDK